MESAKPELHNGEFVPAARGTQLVQQTLAPARTRFQWVKADTLAVAEAGGCLLQTLFFTEGFSATLETFTPM